MEHPFLSVTEIKDSMTLDQIQEKITELTKKLGFAYQASNQPLVNQITMALECYQRAQREMLDDLFNNQDSKNPGGNIDVS